MVGVYRNPPMPVCTTISNPSLGWTIRTIASADDFSVTLNDGVTFMSECFAGAKPGETWAVKHEDAAGHMLGRIRRAVLLESAPSETAFDDPPNHHLLPVRGPLGVCYGVARSFELGRR